jgi:hypothetical protein
MTEEGAAIERRANLERVALTNDLQFIIRELEEVAQTLQPVKGIGMAYCITKLKRLSDKYKRIRQRL